MDIVTLGAALNGSAEYVNSHFKGGSNIQIVDNPDGTQTINASGEVSSEDTVARADIAAIKDGETLDSFGDVETALGDKADKSTTYTKTEVDTALGSKQNTISDLATIRSGAALGATAVQPETGKGLSTNDYTTAEKTKLAGIAEGAEVNVQSNWTQTTTTADDYIKNKPTLGTAAAKNATDTYNATGTDVTTGKAVAAALATLPEPMVFKGSLGTGGTITTLPAASSSNKGYVYKVITAGTYASQSAKVGDTFISDGSAWVIIPSGDEPSGTVTNVAVANGGGLTVSGSPVTSSGTITVGHSNSVTAKTSSSVKKFTYDAYGHVTGSSELSTAESNALASGIDSTKVAQIETNKNNILYNTENGVANIMPVQPSLTKSDSGLNYSISGDKYILSGSRTIAASYYMVTDNIVLRANTDYTIYIDHQNNSTTTQLQIVAWNGSTWVDLTGGTTASISTINSGNYEKFMARLLPNVAVGSSVDDTVRIMITPKSLGVTSYQSYALSNSELTAKEQVNENNILLSLIMPFATNNYNVSNLSVKANATIDTSTGIITQTTTDTQTNLRFQMSAFNGNTIVRYLTDNIIMTNNGVYYLTFTKSSDYNTLIFGHNGSAADFKVALPVSALSNGDYIFKINILNCIQANGSYSFNDIAIVKKTGAYIV